MYACTFYAPLIEPCTDKFQECVSNRAKKAIGVLCTTLDLKPGEPADLILFGKAFTKLRSRKSIAEVVYDPIASRTTIWRGRITHK
jgi:hypothetical protein